MKRSNGFTLVELLAVIVVLAIILAIAVPGITGVIKSSTKSSFKSDAKMVLTAIDYKKLENEDFNPLEITKENMLSTIGLNNINYEQINISVEDGVVSLVLVGRDKWDGLTAYGTIRNMKIVDTDDYDVIPPAITILGSNPKYVGKNSFYIDDGATAYDLKDGDVEISSTVIRNASGTVVEAIDTSTFTTYTITYTAVDSQGNTTSSIRRVNVVDREKPVITLLGDNPVTLSVGEAYSDASATAIDDIDGNITDNILVTGMVNPNVVGTYYINYDVSDESGNAATTVTRTINVVDSIAPEVTFGTNGNSTYAKSRITVVNVNDNVELNIDSLKYLWSTSMTVPEEVDFASTFTSGDTINTPSGVSGSYYLWILAKDIYENITILKSNVFNLDNNAPILTLNGSSSVTINKGSTYSDVGATATDNVDGNITSNIVITGSVNPNVVGSYTITYDVSDSSGNEALQIARTVNVVDVSAPVITILGSNPLNTNVGTSYVEAGATAFDDVDGNVTNNIVTSGTVNSNVAGTYTITYTVKDNANNQSVATRTVNVIDNIPPTVSFAPNGNSTYAKTRSTTVTVNDSHTGVNTSTLKYLWTTSTTAPSEASFTAPFTNGSSLPAGGVTGGFYLWILAKDNANNITITRSNVFNLDNTAPVITMNGSNPVSVIRGATYNDAGATATDNIDGSIYVTVSGTVNTNVAGTYYVYYNATDSSSNVASQVTRTVNVLAPYTITNMIRNGGYENGTNYWSLNSYANIVSDIKYAGSYSVRYDPYAEPNAAMTMQTLAQSSPTYGHKYYGAVMFLSASEFTTYDNRYEWFNTDAVGAHLVFAYKANATTSWVKLSSIQTLPNTTYTSYSWYIRNFIRNSNTYSYADNVLLVDLTETFGAGNEPDLAWCDANIGYFDGSTTVYK